MNSALLKLINETIDEKLNNVKYLKFYHVIFHTHNSSDSIYSGLDYNKAKNEFDKYFPYEDNYQNRSDMSLELSSQVSKYEFVADIDPEYETIDDYPIEEYYKDKNTYRLIDTNESEEIDNRSLEPKNLKSDQLLTDVEDYYKNHYGRRKYNTISITDDNDKELGTINLRIANHTENIFNVDRFNQANYHISVVIAEFDPTKKHYKQTNSLERRRNEFELNFDSSYSSEEIITQVNELIQELTDRLKEKSLKEFVSRIVSEEYSKVK